MTSNWLTEQFERSAKHLLSVDPALLSPVGRDLRRQLERRRGRHLRLVKWWTRCIRGMYHVRMTQPPQIAARITLNLSRKTVEALNATSALTDDNKTEVINKAVQLYREVQEAQHKGGGIWIQGDQSSEPVLTRFY